MFVNRNNAYLLFSFFKITLTKVSNANIYTYKHFYTSLQNNTKQQILGFQNTTLILS